MRPRVKAVVLTCAAVALLALLVWLVEPSKIAEAIGKASLPHLAAAFVVYAAFFLLRGLRWKVLLSQSAPQVPLLSTTSTTAVGWLANSILPLKGGDVLRAALVARRDRVGLGPVAATVGLERVLDLVGLALMAALGLWMLPATADLPAGLDRALAIAWILPLAVVALLALLVARRDATVRIAGRILSPLGRFGETLTRFGETVLAGLAALAARPTLLVILLPLTIVIAVGQAAIFTLLVLAFLPGTSAGLAFAGSTLFVLSFVVSITPGNIGTYELAFAAIFTALGAPPEATLPAAFLTHATTTLTVVMLGGAGLVTLSATRPTRPPNATARGAP